MKTDARDRQRIEEAIARLAATRWPGAAIASVEAIAGDASSRRYVRCRLRGPSAPRAVVAMLMDSREVALSSEELGVFGESGPEEIPFVNVARYLSRFCRAIPEIYDVAADGTCILLEDVGDVSLWAEAGRVPADAELWFERALDLLAEIQRRARDDGTGCYAFHQAFDRRLFAWELDHFLEYGVRPLPEPLERECRRQLDGLAECLAGLDRVFCHRDYHAWNIHVQDGRLRLLDFQDALLGPAAYDAASLLTDRCTPSLVGLDRAAELFERFADRAGLGGRERAAFFDCALQRALKVIGRFHYLADCKGKPGYLSFLPDVVATAKAAAARSGRAGALGEVLENWLRGESETS
ncbi:MAG: hypothetical protein D6815_04160 [Candidatus Dadabacteria bacterium]|nr:MAG: hypothetical protein D6815_04160 [Candidatus Dadabacteria bacterium]